MGCFVLEKRCQTSHRGTYTLHTELKEIPKVSKNSDFWFSLLIVFWENEEWCSLRNRHNFIDWRFWGHTTTFIDVVLLQFKLAIFLFCKKPRGKNALLLAAWAEKLPIFRGEDKKGALFGHGFAFFCAIGTHGRTLLQLIAIINWIWVPGSDWNTYVHVSNTSSEAVTSSQLRIQWRLLLVIVVFIGYGIAFVAIVTAT